MAADFCGAVAVEKAREKGTAALGTAVLLMLASEGNEGRAKPERPLPKREKHFKRVPCEFPKKAFWALEVLEKA